MSRLEAPAEPGLSLPHETSCSLLPRHHAQAPAVLDYSRTLPQRNGDARPALAGSAVGDECNLVVLDTGNMLHDAFAVRRPSIDAEGEVRSSSSCGGNCTEKPNQPEDDSDCSTPRASLSIPARIQKPQSACNKQLQ